MENHSLLDQHGLRMAPPDPECDLDTMAQFIADTFNLQNELEGIRYEYISNSTYDYGISRLVWQGDRLVHHWGVWGYHMRLDSVQLKIGGIGAVGTLEEFRKLGVMHLAALDSIRQMDAEGYDLTILRGRHYRSLGYVRAWNYVTYKLKAEEIPQFPLNQPYRVPVLEDWDAMVEAFNRTYAEICASPVRPTFQPQSLDANMHAWYGENGRLEGYVWVEKLEEEKVLQCFEAAGDPRQALAVLADLVKAGGYEKLYFFTLGYLHPVLQIVRRGACIVEDRYFDISGWRVRIVNLSRTLEKLRPVLEKRLRHSCFVDWNGALGVDAGEQRAVLKIAGGNVSVLPYADGEDCIRGGPAIARLLIGSDDPAEVIRQEDMICTGCAAELVEVLFPNLHPMINKADEY